jgi:hypothetical protein
MNPTIFRVGRGLAVRLIWVPLLFGLTVTDSSAAPIGKARAYPQMRCGIPCRDYQYRLQSSADIRLTTGALNLFSPAADDPRLVGVPAAEHGQIAPQNRIKYFQLDVPQLAVKERTISRVVFQLDDQGMWTLSLRADFHDRTAPRDTPYLDEHHKRCQFRVKVRCFAAYPVDESASNLTTGKPVMLETGDITFWVQSGEPYSLWKHHCCQKWYGKQYFDLINRAEIEFSYYEAAATTRAVEVLPPAQ